MNNSKINRPLWNQENKRSDNLFWLDKNEITIEESQLFNESILNELLPSDETNPYAFYSHNMEIMSDLHDFLELNKLSTESLLTV